MKKIITTTKIILCLWVILFFARFIFAKFDYDRVNNGKKPIFFYGAGAFADGGTVTYYGFGYDLTSLCRFRVKNNLPIGYDKGPIIEYKMSWLFFPLENKKNITFVPNPTFDANAIPGSK